MKWLSEHPFFFLSSVNNIMDGNKQDKAWSTKQLWHFLFLIFNWWVCVNQLVSYVIKMCSTGYILHCYSSDNCKCCYLLSLYSMMPMVGRLLSTNRSKPHFQEDAGITVLFWVVLCPFISLVFYSSFLTTKTLIQLHVVCHSNQSGGG